MIAQAVNKRCSKDHIHKVIIGGNKSAKSQVYPNELISTILRAYKKSLGLEEVYHTTWDSPGENLTLTGWISDIVNTKEQLEQEPKKGYIDLMQEPIPPEILGEAEEDEYEPEQVPDEQEDMDQEFLPTKARTPT